MRRLVSAPALAGLLGAIVINAQTVYDGRAYLVHDTGVLTVLDATSGQQIYKVRVGGGGQTFSASPVPLYCA